MSEIETRRVLPGGPPGEAFSALLGRWLRVDGVLVEAGPGGMTLQVDGELAPWHGQGPQAPAARRVAYMDSLDKVIGLCDLAGATWARHPHVSIDGEVQHRMDGAREFYGLQARVSLELLLPRAF